MHNIVKKYMLLVEKISNTVRQCKIFDTDVDIYRSEIHIIQLIGEHSELYISQISSIIGITKGTVSQIIKRLEGKGLVCKSVDLSNNTRQLVKLTEKGRVAFISHERYHKQQHMEMETFLHSLDREQLAVLEKFLHHADEMIEDHM